MKKETFGQARVGLVGLALLGGTIASCAQSSRSTTDLGPAGVAADDATNTKSARVRVVAPGAGPRSISLPAAAPRQPSKDPEAMARSLLGTWAQEQRIPRGAQPEWSRGDVVSVRDRHVVSLDQRVNGIPVWHARTTLLLSGAGQPRAVTGLPDFHAVLGEFDLSSSEAANIAWQHQRPDAATTLDALPIGADGLERFQLPALASGPTLLGPVRVSRVYFPARAGLTPAFAVGIGSDAPGGDRRGEEIVVSARDGSILAVRVTLAEAHSYRVWTGDAAGTPAEGPLTSLLPYPTTQPSGASPLPTASKLVEVEGLNKNPDGAADPWLPPGATTTSGNNVDAYVDFNDPSGLGGGEFRAAVTSTGVFDHTYDVSKDPLFDVAQSSGAIVQAFYTANWLHDWYYDSGFDEAARNAQDDNFGRGGYAGDVLTIEVQDAAQSAQPARDNANMYTPLDGESPIMQVYVWSATVSTALQANPGGVLPSRYATFGPATFDFAGPLVAVSDGTTDAMDACQPLSQDLTGQIALVRRGGCPFVQKAEAATNAGAIGVLIADNEAGTPPVMDGDSTFASPTLSTTLESGDALLQALASGPVSVELSRTAAVERDGALDGTIVAHEWGHYLQERLAPCWPTAIVDGVPEPSQCYAMGEGGGDFVALHMLLGPGDDPNLAYPVAAYAAAALVPDLYFGLRRFPYSASLDINPLTFRHIENGQEFPDTAVAYPSPAPNAEVHNAGEVWATMLFEVYAALIAEAGGPSDTSSFQDVRRNMSDDLVLALSMMPLERTVLDARDALLAAISARSAADAIAAAKAFAKRGAGSCAVAPAFDSTNNFGVVEDFEVGPRLEVGLLTTRDEECDNGEDGVLDAGETGALVVEVVNLGYGPAADTTVTLSDLPAELASLEGSEVVIALVPGLGVARAEFPLSLEQVSGILDGSVTVAVESPDACTPSLQVSLPVAMNYDVDEAGTGTDDFAGDSQGWSLIGAQATTIWSRQGTGVEALWHGDDYLTDSNTALVSPPVEVSSSVPFQLTLTHRYSFEGTPGAQGGNWDGGVVEISRDDGATWVDASEFAGVDPGYPGSISVMTDNPLTAVSGSDRAAFVGDSPDFPALASQTIDFGDALAGETVRVAFRIGTDSLQEVQADGWDIDDVAFSGAVRGPFPARVADASPSAACPEPKASGGQSGEDDGSGATGGNDTDGGQGSLASGGGATDGSGGDGAAEQPGGCGCRLAATPSSPAPLGLGLLALTLLLGRRRGRSAPRAQRS